MWGVTPRLTLRHRVVATVAVAIIPAVIALPYFIASIHETREREVRDMAVRASQLAALEMERIVTGARGILETLTFAPAVRDFESKACNDYLAEVAPRLPQFDGLAVADLDGKVRCIAGLDPPLGGVRGADWFRDAVKRDAFVVGTYTAPPAPAAAYLPVALPIDRDGQLAAVIMAAIDVHWLADRLGERSFAQGSALAIADRNGILLAREPDSELYIGTRVSDRTMPYVKARVPGAVELVGIDGVTRIVGYQPPAADQDRALHRGGDRQAGGFRPDLPLDLAEHRARRGRGGRRLRDRLAGGRPAVPQADPPHPRHHQQLAERRRDRADRILAATRRRALRARGVDRPLHGRGRGRPRRAGLGRSIGRCCSTR